MEKNKLVYFFNPGSINTRSGGTIYNKTVIEGLQKYGMSIIVKEIEPPFPMLSRKSLLNLEATLTSLPKETVCIVDGLLFGNTLHIFKKYSPRLNIVGLIHLLLTDEGGLTNEEKKQYQTEFKVHDYLTEIIVTSHYMKEKLTTSPFKKQITVIYPGTKSAKRYLGSKNKIKNILFLGSITPRKRPMDLVEALANIKEYKWQCIFAGSLDRHKNYVKQFKESIKDNHLTNRICLMGECNETTCDSLLENTDIYIQTSTFETFGMSIREALIRGIPTITTTKGGSIENINPCSILQFEPGDVKTLTHYLKNLLNNPNQLKKLSTLCWNEKHTIQSWEQTVKQFATLISRYKTVKKPHLKHLL